MILPNFLLLPCLLPLFTNILGLPVQNKTNKNVFTVRSYSAYSNYKPNVLFNAYATPVYKKQEITQDQLHTPQTQATAPTTYHETSTSSWLPKPSVAPSNNQDVNLHQYDYLYDDTADQEPSNVGQYQQHESNAAQEYQQKQSSTAEQYQQSYSNLAEQYQQLPLNVANQYHQQPSNVAEQYQQHSSNLAEQYEQTPNVADQYQQQLSNIAGQYNQQTPNFAEQYQQQPPNVAEQYQQQPPNVAEHYQLQQSTNTEEQYQHPPSNTPDNFHQQQSDLVYSSNHYQEPSQLQSYMYYYDNPAILVPDQHDRDYKNPSQFLQTPPPTQQYNQQIQPPPAPHYEQSIPPPPAPHYEYSAAIPPPPPPPPVVPTEFTPMKRLKKIFKNIKRKDIITPALAGLGVPLAMSLVLLMGGAMVDNAIAIPKFDVEHLIKDKLHPMFQKIVKHRAINSGLLDGFCPEEVACNLGERMRSFKPNGLFLSLLDHVTPSFMQKYKEIFRSSALGDSTKLQCHKYSCGRISNEQREGHQETHLLQERKE